MIPAMKRWRSHSHNSFFKLLTIPLPADTFINCTNKHKENHNVNDTIYTRKIFPTLNNHPVDEAAHENVKLRLAA